VDLEHVTFDASLDKYEAQAAQLLDAHRAGDADALRFFHHRHPRFLDPKTPWLARLDLTDEDIRAAVLTLDDARLALARWYDFRDWPALTAYAASVADRSSPAFEFESAVEAVISGDLPALQSLLTRNPAIVHARSARITHFDPPEHRATLLHYLAANGVEGYRQKSPSNAVAVANALLDAGADPDALARMYGGESTTLPMLVSSTPPANAGVQVPLVDALVDHGSSVEPRGSGNWTSPLMTALVFGYLDAARALVRRGARVDNVALAAGLGQAGEVAQSLPTSDADSRHRALALAAQLGHLEIVRMLLDAGEDPSRYNPAGLHGHATPLHHAVSNGHFDVVRLLVDRSARLDIEDKIYKGTPLGWARHLGKTEIADWLATLSK
jgi:ankyrin repeat protein